MLQGYRHAGDRIVAFEIGRDGNSNDISQATPTTLPHDPYALYTSLLPNLVADPPSTPSPLLRTTPLNQISTNVPNILISLRSLLPNQSLILANDPAATIYTPPHSVIQRFIPLSISFDKVTPQQVVDFATVLFGDVAGGFGTRERSSGAVGEGERVRVAVAVDGIERGVEDEGGCGSRAG